MAILSLQNVTLHVGGNQLLDAVNWSLEDRERIALVGRNGAGKSTLLKLIQGLYVPDAGQINRKTNIRTAGLVQEVPSFDSEESVYHFLVQGLGEKGEAMAAYFEANRSQNLEALSRTQQSIEDYQAWSLITKVETFASKLEINPSLKMRNLSGGMIRRVLLAAALIAEPDILLLDEPTNHLDLPSIEWLESYLKSYAGTLIVVTHDRAFLANVANTIVEIDRGKLHTHHCDYETYLDRREAIRLAEDKAHALFDKKLAEEEVWIRTGIRARRTRNEGRVRALEAMRKAHKDRVTALGKMKTLNMDASKQSGSLVIEAENISHSFGDKKIINQFSLLITRGDKIGIIGPNGSGKTTLIRLLLGELKPDSGTVRQGTALNIAYFDQLRSQLDDNQTLMANVAEGADYVTINGKQKHVASYLKDFLFSPEKFNQIISTLSGGERNRLLLAKLLAKPVNLLVMDEPTNDLDIETLELLETLLIDYPGTLLLISHDREFIDQVVTSVLVYEGEGNFKEYVGGYKDYKALKKEEAAPLLTAERKKTPAIKRSYKEQRELEALPQQIEQLEEKIAAYHAEMTKEDFYQKSSEDLVRFNKTLEEEGDKLATLYKRWEELEEK